MIPYEEEQQDLALLSISTFQRELKDLNQFSFASAIGILSSIPVLISVTILSQVTRKRFLDQIAKQEKINENTEIDNLSGKKSYEDDFDSKFNSTYKKSMDSDNRLLLKVTKPLLQSRNSAVVLAVAQLYYYIAPKK